MLLQVTSLRNLVFGVFLLRLLLITHIHVLNSRLLCVGTVLASAAPVLIRVLHMLSFPHIIYYSV